MAAEETSTTVPDTSAPTPGGATAESARTKVVIPHGAHVPNPFTEGKPRMYMCTYCVSKKANVGNLVRSAVAFGAHELVVIGSAKLSHHGGHGTKAHLFTRRFDSLAGAKEWFTQQGVKVCGIEIGSPSVSVLEAPFTGSTAFLLGNEGTGMSAGARAICDQFVYIPHHGRGTASLNVTVAGSIIMHRFAAWAGYGEASLNSSNGEKYDVAVIQYDGSAASEEAQAKRAQRAAKKARTDAAADVAGAGGGS